MRKLMFVLGLMGIVVFSYAGENKTGKERKMKNDVEQKLKKENKKLVTANEFKMCTVTQTAKVSIYVVDYSVACAVTAESCDKAITDAINCVTTAVNRLKTAIIKATAQ